MSGGGDKLKLELQRQSSAFDSRAVKSCTALRTSLPSYSIAYTSSMTGDDVLRRARALDRQRNVCHCFPMPKALEEITKDAMDLAPRQRIALAEFLLESAEAAADPEAEAAWDSEIRDRIRAIDEGRVTGVAYVDVMRKAEERLAP